MCFSKSSSSSADSTDNFSNYIWSILGSKFSPFALTLILQQVQIVAILGAAQSLVILTAGIDLSVGAIMVLSSVVMGQFTFRYGIPVELGIICGLICGTGCGFVNGWLVAVMRLPPFIVTLGMWQILLATTFITLQMSQFEHKTLRKKQCCFIILAQKYHLQELTLPMVLYSLLYWRWFGLHA